MERHHGAHFRPASASPTSVPLPTTARGVIAISPRRRATVEGYVAVGVADVLLIGQGGDPPAATHRLADQLPRSRELGRPLHAAHELTAAGPS